MSLIRLYAPPRLPAKMASNPGKFQRAKQQKTLFRNGLDLLRGAVNHPFLTVGRTWHAVNTPQSKFGETLGHPIVLLDECAQLACQKRIYSAVYILLHDVVRDSCHAFGRRCCGFNFRRGRGRRGGVGCDSRCWLGGRLWVFMASKNRKRRRSDNPRQFFHFRIEDRR